MKTKYKYIRFELFYDGFWNIWNNRSKDLLGDLRFYDNWKEWELRLERGVAFTKECLLDVVDFINQLESEAKKNKSTS